MNKSDSERIAGYLEKNGLVQAKERPQADLVILTTCGVRQTAEDRIYGLVPKIKKDNPDVLLVLTGCLSERSDVKKRLKDIACGVMVFVCPFRKRIAAHKLYTSIK